MGNFSDKWVLHKQFKAIKIRRSSHHYLVCKMSDTRSLEKVEPRKSLPHIDFFRNPKPIWDESARRITPSGIWFDFWIWFSDYRLHTHPIRYRREWQFLGSLTFWHKPRNKQIPPQSPVTQFSSILAKKTLQIFQIQTKSRSSFTETLLWTEKNQPPATSAPLHWSTLISRLYLVELSHSVDIHFVNPLISSTSTFRQPFHSSTLTWFASPAGGCARGIWSQEALY